MAHEESPNSLMAIIGTKHNICPGPRDHESDRAGLALGCVSCSLTGWVMEPTQQQIDKQSNRIKMTVIFHVSLMHCNSKYHVHDAIPVIVLKLFSAAAIPVNSILGLPPSF